MNPPKSFDPSGCPPPPGSTPDAPGQSDNCEATVKRFFDAWRRGELQMSLEEMLRTLVLEEAREKAERRRHRGSGVRADSPAAGECPTCKGTGIASYLTGARCSCGAQAPASD